MGHCKQAQVMLSLSGKRSQWSNVYQIRTLRSEQLQEQPQYTVRQPHAADQSH